VCSIFANKRHGPDDFNGDNQAVKWHPATRRMHCRAHRDTRVSADTHEFTVEGLPEKVACGSVGPPLASLKIAANCAATQEFPNIL
jgi:hypothetical protein